MRRSALFLAVLVALALSAASAAPTFGDPAQLSGSGINSYRPRVDLDGMVGVAVWEQWTGGTAATSRLFISRTSDGGETWTRRKRVNPSDFEEHHADVVVLGNRVYGAWAARVGTETHYFFNSSTNGGKTWGMVREVGIGPAAAKILDSSVRVAAYGNKVWLAYVDNSGDGWVKYSTDGGENFDGLKQLEASVSVHTKFVRIANDGNNVYVLSATDDDSGAGAGAGATLKYWVQKSTNGGSSFGAVKTIATSQSLGNVEIDAYGSRIGIAWIDESANKTMATSSVDRGATYRPAQAIANTAASAVDVSATAGRLDVVYGGPGGLKLRSLLNRRATYGKEFAVAPGVLGQNGGAMVASSGKRAIFGWIAEKGQRKRVYVRTGGF